MRAFVLWIMALAVSPDYVAQIERWRVDRETRLKADDGWLTLVGLHWLEPGANQIEGRTFTLKDGAVWLDGRKLAPDNPGPADMITTGTKTRFVIDRGGRLGIRVRDREAEYRKNFHGLKWYPVKPGYRVEAKWIPYDQPKHRAINTVIAGVEEHYESPGQAEFVLGGQTMRLEPVLEDQKLFFIFRDKTAGKTTYPAGRFLYADLPKDGKVVLDFNKAYTPPCAFTPYATCPLPRRENHVPVAVEAGELNYAGGH